MTTSHEVNSNGDLSPVRVRRVIDGVVRHTPAGRFALPLALYQGAAHCADMFLIMTAAEAEALFAELGHLLYPHAEGGAT